MVEKFNELLDLLLKHSVESLKVTESLTNTEVFIIVGSADSFASKDYSKTIAFLESLLSTFDGIVISGGTKSGIPGIVGEVAGILKQKKKKKFDLYGFVPQGAQNTDLISEFYDFIIRTKSYEFSSEQVIEYWNYIFEKKIKSTQVRIIGFGGGEISLFEYKLGLLLGASVNIVEGYEGSALKILKDENWEKLVKLDVNSKNVL